MQEQIEYEMINNIFSGIENEDIEVIIEQPYKWVLQIITAIYNNRENIKCLMATIQ